MSDAIRDGNHVPVALGVSTADATVTTPFKVDPATGRLQVANSAVSASGVPGTTPAAIGLFYVNSATTKVYMSTGTASSADWTILN